MYARRQLCLQTFEQFHRLKAWVARVCCVVVALVAERFVSLDALSLIACVRLYYSVRARKRSNNGIYSVAVLRFCSLSLLLLQIAMPALK
jgi:hypothetical protein